MDKVVMDWLRIGIAAMAFILAAKFVFLQVVKIPGLSDAVASV